MSQYGGSNRGGSSAGRPGAARRARGAGLRGGASPYPEVSNMPTPGTGRQNGFPPAYSADQQDLQGTPQVNDRQGRRQKASRGMSNWASKAQHCSPYSGAMSMAILMAFIWGFGLCGFGYVCKSLFPFPSLSPCCLVDQDGLWEG